MIFPALRGPQVIASRKRIAVATVTASLRDAFRGSVRCWPFPRSDLLLRRRFESPLPVAARGPRSSRTPLGWVKVCRVVGVSGLGNGGCRGSVDGGGWRLRYAPHNRRLQLTAGKVGGRGQEGSAAAEALLVSWMPI